VIVESIKIHGHDVYYLPREQWDDNDPIFGENIQSRFERAYQMEMYIANVDGWEGQGDFFSKFGLELRDNSNFVVAKRTFDKYMPTKITIRPREGDLIYVPVMMKMFEIKFVEERLLFFTRGNKIPYMFELRCEAFRFNNEKISTGVDVLDSVNDTAAYSVQISVSGTGNYNIGETVYQGTGILSSTSSARVVQWNPNSRKLDVNNVIGTFDPAYGQVIGSESNTRCSIIDSDTMGDHVYYDFFNNRDIQVEANTVVDLSETNPFGNP
jgi:alpha-acetolactate decarboxylase